MKAPAFIRNWDESQKASAVKLLGLAVAALALFILIATVSYLLHWKQDMSFVPGQEVANAAGSLGYRTGKFFVCDFLGLGSFALLIILVAVAVKLLTGRWIGSFAKTVFLTLTGASVASLLLAFIGQIAGLGNAFGGGLGGALGASITGWSIRVLGPVVTAVAILLLVGLWLFFTSSRFNVWLAGLWNRNPGERPPREPAAPTVQAKPETEVEELRPAPVISRPRNKTVPAEEKKPAEE